MTPNNVVELVAPGFLAAAELVILFVALKWSNRTWRAIKAGNGWPAVVIAAVTGLLAKFTLDVFGPYVVSPRWWSTTIDTPQGWYLAVAMIVLGVAAYVLTVLSLMSAVGALHALQIWLDRPGKGEWDTVPNIVRLRRKWHIARIESRVAALLGKQLSRADKQAGTSIVYVTSFGPDEASTLYRIEFPGADDTDSGRRALVRERIAAHVTEILQNDPAVTATSGATETETSVAGLRVQWNLPMLSRPMLTPPQDWDPTTQRVLRRMTFNGPRWAWTSPSPRRSRAISDAS